MAAAEARAAWQRTANRCFVQEDAKRAPKLACCQSSSSSSNKIDAGPTSAADGQDHPVAGFPPPNRNPSYSNLPPDTRWWLQLQPSYGYQKGLTYEQINALEAEVKALIAEPSSKISEATQQDKGYESYVDAHHRVSAVCMKKDCEVKKEEVHVICGINKDVLETMNMRGNFESTEMDPLGCPVSKQSNEPLFDPEAPWVGAVKKEPWWRTTDREELASLVAQKSLDRIENCDLPSPQKMPVKRHPYDPLGRYDHDESSTSLLNRQSQTGCIPVPTLHAQRSLSPQRREWASVEGGQSQCASNKPYSSNTIIYKDSTEKKLFSDSDPSKAQLLEALRHSQTRAREAENAAKRACAEKEDIIKLFFRQASQLFAYKQWFQLLQLESLYLQIKNNDKPISTLVPMVVPWMPYKGKKLCKSLHKASKGKRGKQVHPRLGITKYAVAFALGLSLVGAGLLLGWTVGWLLPF
ncbi:hypothetical protein CFOL_v3_33050 [Cephalotus follicularis]|uniref:Uncharacterized protein n=1 Tax=Cephalotus follicularis TaxID=3775 RepID=A0A1Q3DAT6_CEPFO|nr:hypothetical protein CFOL_v3_33050 [Cephalotus follicularis]